MLKNYDKILLDILLPPICLSCGTEGAYICEPCFQALKKYSFFICPICKKRTPDGKLDRDCRKKSGLNRFLGAPLPYYQETVKKLLHSFKYKYAKDIAAPLSKMLTDFLDENNFADIASPQKSKMIVVPVPLYNFRERERGFNHAGEIAKKVSVKYALPLDLASLKKSKNTQTQAQTTTKEERSVNVSGAFKCSNENAVSGKIALLIDDVYTTGATMRECAGVLRGGGAIEVWGVTVSR
ncbi:MAG: hypothetical protein A3B96_03915 [Candidatus Spechtbacteria bacterium RIFCSPHIGHO2_02_FULL_43_15b]|uniref:Phosphoribosyltransferase domain-containing protein n=1 Tax=Candidatus Spechtbacteria bacterium RIFCSPHIGHO2_01_FULL_43_30 TaxID=1802158 RepID=A0A1G2H880_9BACT|nr:MAG: hypothetical protein A2827_03430 [Candidatus Spechtbacteria bacterium RIFCSPHIGHO2_01_FULL_43_30]OGZ59153.1 MAG: hypothetical protein A3B96_03915 [Candidatus Spechtbacteria bacterium RIFCSPHIGHO2_02_FULL_43_15b]